MTSASFALDGQRVTLTDHAQQRILDMGLDAEDVRRAITNPAHIAESRKYPDSHHRQYGDFSLSCTVRDGNELVVITAVWATDEAWRADLLTRPSGDRVYRKFHTPRGIT